MITIAQRQSLPLNQTIPRPSRHPLEPLRLPSVTTFDHLTQSVPPQFRLCNTMNLQVPLDRQILTLFQVPLGLRRLLNLHHLLGQPLLPLIRQLLIRPLPPPVFPRHQFHVGFVKASSPLPPHRSKNNNGISHDCFFISSSDDIVVIVILYCYYYFRMGCSVGETHPRRKF